MAEDDLCGKIVSRLVAGDPTMPKRVLTDGERSVTAQRAEADGVRLAVVFIRSDGWTIGAPVHLIDKAHGLWSATWVGFWLPHEWKARPFANGKSSVQSCALSNGE